MKNYIFKTLLTLAFAAFTLPLLSQDYLTLYLKNGQKERHLLSLVKSISTSRYDLEGVLHSDFQIQQVFLEDTVYSYLIEDIDSVSFRKVDLEQVAADLSNVVTTVNTLLEESSAPDFSLIANEIHNMEGVEEVQLEDDALMVRIKDWRNIVFYKAPKKTYPMQTRSVSTISKVNNKSTITANKSVNVVIANQFINNEDAIVVDEKIQKTISNFESLGYTVEYIKDLDFDFYYSKLFDYDIVWLETHGHYAFGKHWLLTNYELAKSDNETASTIVEFLKRGWTYFKDDLDDVTCYCVDEKRNGKTKWIFYAAVSEDYIRKSSSKFKNGTIFFSGACGSIKKTEELPTIFFNKGASAYLGYDNTAYYSHDSGFIFLYNLLNGLSVKTSYEFLPEERKKESDTKEKACLKLLTKNEKSKEKFITKTVTAPNTEIKCIALNEGQHQIYLKGYTSALKNIVWGGFDISKNRDMTNPSRVTCDLVETDNEHGNFILSASIKVKEPSGTTIYYRAFTCDDVNLNKGEIIPFTIYNLEISQTSLNLELGKVGNVKISGSGEFEATSNDPGIVTVSINNLREGNANLLIQTHKAGSATITVTDKKTGQTAKIEVTVTQKIADLQLSATKISLVEGNNGTVEITSGSGEYGVTNLNSDKAKATLEGTTITIQALAVGEAKVVVTDIKTGQKIIIEVTVTQGTTYPDIALSTQEVYLNVGDTEQIEVTSGSGSYSVWVYAPEVANVTISGKTITIKALSLGSTVVKVTDEVTKKTTTFGIAVIPPSAYDKYAVDLGLSVKWSQINVGAVSVEDWGEHYAWGETESKSYFSWSSYDLCNGTESTITKYNSHDGKTILEPSDDAATVVMGRNWRTPTLTEMEELVNRCKWTQETLNGVKGMRVTGPNGNSIFLPFGGEMSEDVLHHSDTTGYYYVSNLSSDGEKYAPALVCYGNKQEFVPHARFFGLSIRPVFSKK